MIRGDGERGARERIYTPPPYVPPLVSCDVVPGLLMQSIMYERGDFECFSDYAYLYFVLFCLDTHDLFGFVLERRAEEHAHHDGSS
jgi:hypothetical protein